MMKRFIKKERGVSNKCVHCGAIILDKHWTSKYCGVCALRAKQLQKQRYDVKRGQR